MSKLTKEQRDYEKKLESMFGKDSLFQIVREIGEDSKMSIKSIQLTFELKSPTLAVKVLQEALKPKIVKLLSASRGGSHVDGSVLVEPPKVAKFLLLLIPKRNREGLLGDLHEEFQTILLPEYGVRLASFYYWWHVTCACTSCALSACVAVVKAFYKSA